MIRNGKLFAIHSDHLGTPRLMTNDQNQPVWQWPYSAFGNNKPTGVLKATPNPKAAITNVPVLLKATGPTEMTLRFPGQEEDAELAMRQNFHRIFRQSEGRYTQVDPIGLHGGTNRFIYTEADPLNKTDPEGLKAEPGDTALHLPTQNCSCMEKCLQASHNEAYEACAVPSAWLGRLTKIPGAGLLVGAFCKKAYTENQCRQMCGDFCAGKAECPQAFRD